MGQVLCVTGMHRSGTSLVASWLEACGLAIDDGRRYGPDVGNPKGHFEDAEFAQVQGQAIHRLARFSRGWIVTRATIPAPDKQFLDEARELVQKREAKFAFWGWKDPRSVIFLEEWKRLVPHLRTLLVWRPCHEVVASLTARARAAGKPEYRIGTGRAVAVWVAYNRRALAFKQGHPADTLLVPLSAAVRRDREVIERLRALGLPLAYTAIADCYDSDLLKFRPASTAMRIWGTLRGVSQLEAELVKGSDLTE